MADASAQRLEARSETMLSDSEAQYRLLFESHPHPMWVFDPETLVFLAVNDAAIQHYGYTREEFLSMTIRDIRPPEDIPLLLQAHSKVNKKLGPVGTWRHRKKDGTLIEAEVTTSGIIFGGRTAELVLAIDVTERRRAEQALRESEKRYRMIIENIHEIVYMVHTSADPSGAELQFMSSQVENIMGYRPEEFLDDPGLFFRIIHPDDLQGFIELTRIIFSNRKDETREYRLRHKLTGAYHWVEDKVVPQIGPDGRVASVFGVARDITERKKTEKELNESQERFHLVARATNDAIWDWDLATNKVRWNQAVQTLFHYSPDEVSSDLSWWSDRIHPEDRKRVVSGIQGVIARAGHSWTSEYRFRRKEGSYAYVLDRSYAMHDAQGKPVRMVGAMIDITARKQAEEALAAEKERLAVTLRSIGEGVITTDTAGRIVLMNEVAENLTGWTQAEILHGTLDEVFHVVDDRTGLPSESPVQQVLRTNEIVKFAHHLRLKRRDGKMRLITACAAPIRDKSGAIIGVVLVFGDVTEKQKMEEELLKATKLEAVGLLAGGIAHDFNNLLTAIMGNIALAKMLTDPEEMLFERLSDAEKASLRARDLAQQLLTFAKGGVPIKRMTSIPELLKDTVHFALRGSNIRSEFSISPDLWPVEIDDGQITQVIQNLVINAQQAMQEGGIIRVEAENITVRSDRERSLPLKKGNYVRIVIQDKGIGIRKEHLDKIFDPYFTTKQTGSGLGLTTSYSIIKKHDGNITVESEWGKGTTFSLYLPAQPLGTPSKEVAEKTMPAGSGKVLVMDDEEIVREVAGNLLEHIGYQVGLAGEGAEAIEIYKEAIASGRPFDAVIMDITVPGGMGGKETLQRLIEIDPKVKAIVSSGYSNDPIMADYSKYGFKGVIAKPYKLATLNQTLRRIIEEKDEKGRG
jgi:PAS domain S-box-containing protein